MELIFVSEITIVIVQALTSVIANGLIFKGFPGVIKPGKVPGFA